VTGQKAEADPFISHERKKSPKREQEKKRRNLDLLCYLLDQYALRGRARADHLLPFLLKRRRLEGKEGSRRGKTRATCVPPLTSRGGRPRFTWSPYVEKKRGSRLKRREGKKASR